MTYKKQFDLNLSDINIIETCLRKELHFRSEEYNKSIGQDDPGAVDVRKHGVAEISELLGKIHNQKIWFGGKPDEPWQPKG